MQRHSLIHLRCGTAFLLWVMVIAILVFALLGEVVGHLASEWLVVSRVVALPLIAGLAYEVIRLAAQVRALPRSCASCSHRDSGCSA